jgi:hypothetical protein
MTPAAHASAGLLVFAFCPGPWPVKLATAVVSHIVVDAASGWHPVDDKPGSSWASTVWNGGTLEKRAVIAANVLGAGVACWFVWLHPGAILYVMAAGLMDMEWVARWLRPAWRLWSPHRRLVDPIARRIWGDRRDWPGALWLEIAFCLSGGLGIGIGRGGGL